MVWRQQYHLTLLELLAYELADVLLHLSEYLLYHYFHCIVVRRSTIVAITIASYKELRERLVQQLIQGT